MVTRISCSSLRSTKGTLIVDAGGGTIDVSAYQQKSPYSQSYEEVAVPQYHFRGSIFVTAQARNLSAVLILFLQCYNVITRVAGAIPLQNGYTPHSRKF
jgi:hypothetical protein